MPCLNEIKKIHFNLCIAKNSRFILHPRNNK
jgi:hypothetical protein